LSLTIRSKRNIEIINPKLYNHDPVSGNRLYSITILINTIRTLADTKIFSALHFLGFMQRGSSALSVAASVKLLLKAEFFLRSQTAAGWGFFH
jgi:hypothetical protein